MPMILLKLLGVWNWLKEALSALLGLIRRYPREAAIIALLCLSGGLWRALSHEKAVHLADNAKHKAELAQIDAQSKANLAAQIAQNAKWEATSKQAAKENDIAYEKGLADARTAADRYARAHRVRSDQGGFSAAPTPGETDPAPRRDGPGAETELVAITREDFDRCTVNSQRIDVVHTWGEGLQAKGLAVPDPAF